MKIHNVIQGSPEWLQLRATYFTASEAPAMMGCSPYQTRSELLNQKHTGLAQEVNAATQRLFNDGHATEAQFRPIAEAIIGDDLYPVTGSLDLDGLPLLASFDGLTMDYGIGYEHKLWSQANVRAIEETGEPPLYHCWQMEHQMLVSGAAYILFATSNGTEETSRTCCYTYQHERRAALIAGWKQFSADLAAYVPSVISEKPKADAIMELPALFLHARGEITDSNMEEFGRALAASLDAARRQVLISDQDFSNAEAAAKQYRETCKKLMLAKDAMLAQTVTIGEAARLIDTWHEDLRVTALKLEKDCEREKEAKKLAIINAARLAYAEHIASLEAEIAPARLSIAAPDFAGAMKGKRLISAWQDAVDSALAAGKIAADAQAKAIRANMVVFHQDAKGYEFLFADLAQLVSKPIDDFTLVVQSRVSARKNADAKAKADAEAAAIAKVEADRLEAEAKAKAELAAKELAQSAASQVSTAIGDAVMTGTGIVRMSEESVMRINPASVTDTGARLKLGDINARLAPIQISAAGLHELGFEPAGKDKSAVLYRESDFTRICSAIANHAARAAQPITNPRRAA